METFEQLIEKAFKDETRKTGGPYFEHLKRVKESSLKFVHRLRHEKDSSYYDKLVAPLANKDNETVDRVMGAIASAHDFIENIAGTAQLFDLITDSELKDLDYKDIAFIMTSVLDLSRRENESYFDYIGRVLKSNIFVKTVKAADLQDNMGDLKEGTLKDKYRFAQDTIQNSFWN